MRLSEYMELKELSDEQFAEKLRGPPARATVTRYRNRTITPPPWRIAEIEKLTGGAVRLEDWIRSEAAE